MAAKTETKKKPAPAVQKPRAPRVKDWRRTAGYRDVRKALVALLGDAAAAPMTADRIEEYMSLWCQRQMLYDDVRKRGPTVVDDRGRLSENRSISLGVQVSKQMMALYSAMGLRTPEQTSSSAEKPAEEDDPL